MEMTRDRLAERFNAVAAGAVLLVPAAVFSILASESFRYPKLWTGEGLVFLCSLGAWVAWRGRPFREADPADVVWGLTAMAAGVSLVNTSHLLTGASEIMRLVSLVLAFSLFRRVPNLRRLLPVIVLAAVVNAGLACAQAGGWRASWMSREGRHAVYGTFGNPNFLAEYLAPVIILGVGAALEAAGRGWLGWAAAACLMLAALLLTVSRSGWLGLAAGSAVFLLLALPAIRSAGRMRRLAWTGAALLAIAATLWSPLWVRVSSSFGTADPGVTTRVFMWKAAVAQFKDHPVLGAGPGGYSLGYLDYAARLQESGGARPGYAGITQEAHNDALQLLAERGLAGAVLWVAAFCFLGFRAVRSTPGPAEAEPSRIGHAAAAGAVTAVLVESGLGFPMRIFPTASVLLWSLARMTPLRATRDAWLPGLISFRTLILCPPLLWFLGRTLAADGALALGRGRPDTGAETRLREGLRLLPWHGELEFRLGLNLLAQGREGEAAAEFQRALAGFKDPDVYFNLGTIASRQKRFNESAGWFREGLRRYPYFNARPYADLAEALLGAGRRDEARDAAARALEIDPGLASARAVLQKVEKRRKGG
jgi:O-antigen ligase